MGASRRVYPLVLCPFGHSTAARRHNRIRYCARCKLHYTHAGAVYEPVVYREWRAVGDKRQTSKMSADARQRLLAEIERIEKIEHAAALAKWRASER